MTQILTGAAAPPIHPLPTPTVHSIDRGLGVPGLNMKAVEKFNFHVGLRPDAPVYSFHCEGVTFARYSVKFGPADTAGNRDEYRRPGMYLKLTRENVERCQKSIRNFVARFNLDDKGVVVGGEVHLIHNPGFELQPGDRPIADFCYCKLAPEIPSTEIPGFDIPGSDAQQLKAADDAEQAAAAQRAEAAEASETARADDPVSQAAKAKHAAKKGARAANLPDPFAS